MDALSSIFTWLSDHEAGISAVVGITVLAGVLFAGLRSLVRRRAETSPDKAPGDSAEPAPTTDSSPADLDPLTVPGFEGRPAIAVLPFDNLSGDPDQEYFADGIAEDLITRLSHCRWFPVIARNSSFTYKGKPVDVKQVSRELGVQYVVEGSVRKVGDRVRITAQLIDATTGGHVWAERYDRELEDIFAIQDEITETIVGSIGPQLEQSELDRAARQEPTTIDAWDLVQRGFWHFFRFTEEDNARAGSLFRQAAEVDPDSAGAATGMAWVHYYELMNQWTDSLVRSVEELREQARRSVALDNASPMGQLVLGCACLFDGKRDEAEGAFERALELNPSFATGYYLLGLWLARWLRPQEAIEKLEKAIRLSPKDPLINFYFYGLAVAHFAAERYEEAVAWSRKSLQVRGDYSLTLATLAASLAHLGRKEQAQAAGEDFLRAFPGFSLSGLQVFISGADPAFVERYLDGLRKAGLPE